MGENPLKWASKWRLDEALCGSPGSTQTFPCVSMPPRTTGSHCSTRSWWVPRCCRWAWQELTRGSSVFTSTAPTATSKPPERVEYPRNWAHGHPRANIGHLGQGHTLFWSPPSLSLTLQPKIQRRGCDAVCLKPLQCYPTFAATRTPTEQACGSVPLTATWQGEYSFQVSLNSSSPCGKG